MSIMTGDLDLIKKLLNFLMNFDCYVIEKDNEYSVSVILSTWSLILALIDRLSGITIVWRATF